MADISSFMTFSQVCDKSNTTGTASGAGTLQKLAEDRICYISKMQQFILPWSFREDFWNFSQSKSSVDFNKPAWMFGQHNKHKINKEHSMPNPVKVSSNWPIGFREHAEKINTWKVYTANNYDNICQVMTIQ